MTTGRIVACLNTIELLANSDGGSRWRAATLGVAGGGVYGGQLLGQAIAVASRLDPSMPVKSIHAVFPRRVADTGSLNFDVSVLHRGSAYSTQRVEVSQLDNHGNPATVYSAHVICHRPVDGINHQQSMPAHAGSPDDARPADLGLIPWETRVVGDADLNERGSQPNELLLWTRVGDSARDALGDGVLAHQALLAFLSDLTLIGTALLQHEGWSQLDAHGALRTSVVSHQLSFHRPFRIDQWMLIAQSSPAAADGSAFGAGHVYSLGGDLVASFAQESMVRVADVAARGAR